MLYILTMVLISIICLVLIVIILLQSGQGGGLSGGIAGNAGGGSGMVGARRTADFLSKSTSVLGAVFLALCVLANFFIDGSTQEQSTIQRTGVEVPLQPSELELPAQQQPAIPQQPPVENNDNDE